MIKLKENQSQWLLNEYENLKKFNIIKEENFKKIIQIFLNTTEDIDKIISLSILELINEKTILSPRFQEKSHLKESLAYFINSNSLKIKYDLTKEKEKNND